MKYLVIGNEGPGFFSADEAIEMLENIILPAFEELDDLDFTRHLLRLEQRR